MNRFFVQPENISDSHIVIDNKEDVNHITKVLRLCINNIIIVCDGFRNDYEVVIEEIDKSFVKAKIIKQYENKNEPDIDVVLFQGLPKSSKMELIIQKAVELGVNRVVPVITERTVVRLEDKKTINKKVERWQKVSSEACKQCRRGIIPQISHPLKYEQAIEEAKSLQTVLFPYENEHSNALKGILRCEEKIKSVGIFIGPEGGFDNQEIDIALRNNFDVITLGPRILRTETAGLAVISVIMYELGDLSK